MSDRGWRDGDEWDRARRGVDCPMCADAHLPTNPHSDLITATPHSFVRLHRNQTRPGYCVIICRRHVAELHELDEAERHGFIDDIASVGRVIERQFAPVKLDTLMMGHRCPHLHCHLYPQYEHDDPHALVDINAGGVRLAAADQQARVALLRRALD